MPPSQIYSQNFGMALSFYILVEGMLSPQAVSVFHFSFKTGYWDPTRKCRCLNEVPGTWPAHMSSTLVRLNGKMGRVRVDRWHHRPDNWSGIRQHGEVDRRGARSVSPLRASVLD